MRVYAEPSAEKTKIKTTKAYFFKLSVQESSNLGLKILERHFDVISGPSIRKRKIPYLIGNLTVGNGELTLFQTNNGFVSAAVLDKDDCVFPGFKCRHSRH